jgi:hypothetical protein
MDTQLFEVGDIVKISLGAKYFNGKPILPTIQSRQWIVSSISGNRVVLGTSDDGFYSLYAPIDAKYLTKV